MPETYKSKLDEAHKLCKATEAQINLLRKALQAQAAEEIEKHKAECEQFQQDYHHLNEKADVTVPTLVSAVDFLNDSMLPSFKEALGQLIEKCQDPKKNQDAYLEGEADLKIICNKLNTVLEYLPSAAIYPKDDLFAEDRTSDKWKSLLEYCKLNTTCPKSSARKELERFSRITNIANATVSKTSDKKGLMSHFNVVT